MTPQDQVNTHISIIRAIMKSYSLPSGALLEIEAALEGFKKESDKWEETEITYNDGDHDCIDEVKSMPGHYVIVAKGMIEQERVGKLIESLKYSPYEAALI